MPAATLEKLVQLATDGATVAFMDGLPGDVPGLADLAQQQTKFKSLVSQIKFDSADAPVKKAKVGSGTILVGSDADALLAQTGAIREPMADKGLWFVRRTSAGRFQLFHRQPWRDSGGWLGHARPRGQIRRSS